MKNQKTKDKLIEVMLEKYYEQDMHEERLIEVDLEEFYEQGINEELLIEVELEDHYEKGMALEKHNYNIRNETLSLWP